MLLSRMSNGAPEIFATIQGEGTSAGVPSVFIRLAECNLRCTWCDTKYTWDWDAHDKAHETMELGINDIAARAVEEAGPGVRTAIFTGGEPLLQQDDLALLGVKLKEQGFRIEVETNGTIVPTPAMADVVTQWNVSPKLASSGNPERARHRPNALAWFAAQPHASFKIVQTGEDDLVETEELVAALGVPRDRIVLMPEGTDPITLAGRSRWLAEKCRANGYRLGTRLHVFLWGQERGR